MDWGFIFETTARAAVGQQAIIAALAAVGLNVHFGYTGLLNFGQVGFMAVGGYGVAISVLEFDVPLGIGVLIGMAAAAGLALLLGIPTLRLRADYLAIVTIAAGEIIRFLITAPTWREVTGGSDGLTGFAGAFQDINPIPDGEYGFGPWEYSESGLWQLVVGWGLVLLAVLLVWQLMRSPWGRVVRSIREDEDAARALGKNAYSYKMQSLVLGGVIGAFGGMFWVITQAAVTPQQFAPTQTFYAYVALILGGAARTWGPVVGSMILWGLITFTDSFLRQGISAGYIPDSFMDDNQVGQVRFMLIGVGMALLVVFRPQGIFGDRREIALEIR